MPDRKWQIAVIVALGMLSFLPSLWGGFVFDDRLLMVHPVILNGSLKQVLTSGLLDILGTNCGGYWRPVGLVSIWLENKIFGLRPFFFKLDNILIHILTSILIFFLLLKFLKLINFNSENAQKVSFFAVALFSVHTTHTEAIAMVSGRYDLFATMFVIVSFYFFIRWISTDKLSRAIVWLFVSIALYLVASMSKESAVPLPLAIMALAIFPKLPRRKIFWGVMAFFLVFWIIYMPLRWSFSFGAIQLLRYGDKLQGAIFNLPHTFSRYLQLAVFPFYPNPVYSIDIFSIAFDFRTIVSWIISLPILIIAAITLLKRRFEGYAIAWFIVFLLPVLGILNTAGAFIADRYIYIASIGFTGAISSFWVIKYFKRKTGRFLLWGYIGAMLVSSFLYTQFVWTGQDKLARFMMLRSPRRSIGYIMASIEEIRRNNPQKTLEYIARYKNKNGIGGKEFCNTAAIAHSMLGQTDSVVFYYKHAIRLDPTDYKLQNNLGYIFFQNGELDSALVHFKWSAQINSEYPFALKNLTDIWLEMGDTIKAGRFFSMLENVAGQDTKFDYYIEEKKAIFGK